MLQPGAKTAACNHCSSPLLIVIVPLLAPIPHLVDLVDDDIAKAFPNIESVLNFLVSLLRPLRLFGNLHLLCNARPLFGRP